jgi:hypothetical protein
VLLPAAGRTVTIMVMALYPYSSPTIRQMRRRIINLNKDTKRLNLQHIGEKSGILCKFFGFRAEAKNGLRTQYRAYMFNRYRYLSILPINWGQIKFATSIINSNTPRQLTAGHLTLLVPVPYIVISSLQ